MIRGKWSGGSSSAECYECERCEDEVFHGMGFSCGRLYHNFIAKLLFRVEHTACRTYPHDCRRKLHPVHALSFLQLKIDWSISKGRWDLRMANRTNFKLLWWRRRNRDRCGNWCVGSAASGCSHWQSGEKNSARDSHFARYCLMYSFHFMRFFFFQLRLIRVPIGVLR